MKRRYEILIVAAAAATVAITALPFSSSTLGKVGPGTMQVSMAAVPSGRTVLELPPLGQVTAATHSAPTAVRLRLEEIDVRAVRSLGDPLGLPDQERLVAAVSDDLPGLFRSMVLRTLLISMAIGAAVGAIAPRRRSTGTGTVVRRVVAGAVVAPVAVAALASSSLLGYDTGAFDSPTLSGQLSLVQPYLQDAQGGITESLTLIDERTRALSEQLVELYSSATTNEIAATSGETVILHVSDIHLNPVGVSLARELSETFGVDAVLDTGDLTSFGQEPEAAMLTELSEFDVPYLFVAGNHDGSGARRRIAEIPGVTAIDKKIFEVGGVRILGIDDPTQTALRTIPRATIQRTYEAQYPLIERLVARDQPDLLAVHNPLQATPVLGKVPAVAAGHRHKFELGRVDGTVVAVVGSSGATGLGSLLVETGEPYSFELLRFVDGELVAVDSLQLRGTNGEFDSRRRLVRPEVDLDDDPGIVDDLVIEPSLEDVGPAGEG